MPCIKRCLDILAGYGVAPQDFHLLHQYWYRLVMVKIESSHHGDPFKGYRGVTQGYLLSPTIFNVAVDAVLCHCVAEVSRHVVGLDGFGMAAGQVTTFFNA